MPVAIFAIYKVYYFYPRGKISFVIFISIIRKGHLFGDFLIFIYILLVFFFSYVYLLSKPSSLNLSSLCVVYSSGVFFQNKGNRNYSTSSRSEDPLGNSSEGKGSKISKNNKSTSKRKTLTSLRVKAYEDLYAGRGIPSNEPIWVKGNGLERSPFGASWAKHEKDRLPLPSNYPCNYVNISDPFNNKNLIKEACRGYRVVYIWTYIPTGVCLVGSSSNSVERVLSYFEKKYLFLDTRRGVQFLADYGFKNIQLTIIYFAYHEYTTRDIKINEAYYINELNSSLNSQKFVYLPPEPLEAVLPFINISNRDTSVPIFVYGPDLKRVLYIFNSKTSLYNEFNIHWSTVDKYLDKLNNKLFDYFTFSTLILEGSDLDNLLSLNELLDIKTKVDPKIPRRGQRVKLKDLTNNQEYELYSVSKAAKFIEDVVGTCDVATLRNSMKKNTIYKKRWVIEKL